MDFGYYLPETSINCFPSLMSPISAFEKYKQTSRSKGIFDRLQADTELRLRARHNSVSTSRFVQERPAVSIEDKLIRKGKERETRLRHLIEQEELKRTQVLQDRPYISPNSKAILEGKNFNNSRISTSKPVKKIEKIEINEKPENENSENTKKLNLHPKTIQDLKKTPEPSLKTSQSQLIKQLQNSYKLLSSKKKPQSPAFEVKCSNRKYIPSFTKQSNWKSLLPKSSSLSSSSLFFKPSPVLSYKELRPSSYLICETGVGISQALTYQQMIRNRVMNSINK